MSALRKADKAGEEENSMDIGLLFPFRNPPQWRKPFPRFYAEQLRQTQIAESLGYDTLWLTEHHFAEDGYSLRRGNLSCFLGLSSTRKEFL
jgi:alkanesulfonate monooxygenase SsuD/methylene tetrahydromethanopterin reductase-like flavin-dependent oxidoreductase (luciferase family)